MGPVSQTMAPCPHALPEAGGQGGQGQQQGSRGDQGLIEGRGRSAEVGEICLLATPGEVAELGEAPEQGPLHPSQGKAEQGAGPASEQAQQCAFAQCLGEAHSREFARLAPEPGSSLQPGQGQGIPLEQGTAGTGQGAQGARLYQQQQA